MFNIHDYALRGWRLYDYEVVRVNIVYIHAVYVVVLNLILSEIRFSKHKRIGALSLRTKLINSLYYYGTYAYTINKRLIATLQYNRGYYSII